MAQEWESADMLLADLDRVATGSPEAESRRFYRVAGVTLEVQSDRSFSRDTFAPKFDLFQVDGPGDDTIVPSARSSPSLQRISRLLIARSRPTCVVWLRSCCEEGC